MTAPNTIRFPIGPIVDSSGFISLEWQQWLQNPQFVTLTVNGTALPPPSGPGAQSCTFLEDAEQGEQGIIGPRGLTGADGLQGIPGRDGIDGEDGFTIIGPRGAAGVMGLMGPPGLDGDSGEDGVPGPRGADGAAGATGAAGAAGAMGPPGMVGEDADYPLMIPGPVGPTGATGAVSDPLTQSYSPGSFTVATEKYAVMSRHLKLTSTQRATLAGTATLRIT